MLNAQIADAIAGDLRIRAATVNATGPLNAIAAHFDMRGHLRQAPLTFEGTAIYDSKRNETHIQGQGALADAAISTRTPIHAHWSDGAMEAELDMSIADGAIANVKLANSSSTVTTSAPLGGGDALHRPEPAAGAAPRRRRGRGDPDRPVAHA